MSQANNANVWLIFDIVDGDQIYFHSNCSGQNDVISEA
jgi:hypothetical protein